jgi:hypothetical protein
LSFLLNKADGQLDHIFAEYFCGNSEVPVVKPTGVRFNILERAAFENERVPSGNVVHCVYKVGILNVTFKGVQMFV